ncbi:hypothetical protein FHX15_003143 [Rhizobium sp. BK650]|nr:hypothetical protein [Rhizobium sp. BK650]
MNGQSSPMSQKRMLSGTFQLLNAKLCKAISDVEIAVRYVVPDRGS